MQGYQQILLKYKPPINITGGPEPWYHPIIPIIGATVKLAFTGTTLLKCK